jgi:hypothetical protein
MSVAGPLLSVAITPDEHLALVTSAMRINPADAMKQIPNNLASVIDLQIAPLSVIAMLVKIYLDFYLEINY